MSTPEVLVVGDANVDLVLTGDARPRWGQTEQLLDAAELTLGGSAALVAHGLARLGVRVGLAAAVGRDAFGDRALDVLTSAGVDVSAVVRRAEGGTGISVILSPDDGDRAILTELGVLPSLTRDDLPALDGVSHVHAASPYLVHGLRPDLPALLAEARTGGVTTSVDTNDDPARAWVLLPDLLHAADVVLPNRDELVRWSAALGQSVTGWKEAAQVIAARGPKVVVKVGAEGGALIRAGEPPLQVPAPRVTPVDTTGAGDSFDAGWIAGRLAGRDDRGALTWAVRAGSLSTRAAGGATAQPTAAELAALSG
ncbi:MAG: carbohydrate kinase family protein [Nocardioidaceae bacterium]